MAKKEREDVDGFLLIREAAAEFRVSVRQIKLAIVAGNIATCPGRGRSKLVRRSVMTKWMMKREAAASKKGKAS